MRLRFFSSTLKPGYLVLLFSLHAAAGCFHNWIAYHYYPNHGDIWYYFEESIAMKQQLLQHPLNFFAGMFSPDWLNVTDNSKPLLDVQYQALQYLNVFLNLVSFDNFYINTLLFSFPVFAGMIALFKVFYAVFKKSLPAFCTLLLPSVLFWTAVLHKDSLFYMAIGFFFYYLLKPGMPWWRQVVLLLICVVLMILSRANALITLFPAVFFYLLAEKQRMKKSLSMAVTIGFFAIAALVFNRLVPGGILQGVSERQKDFQAMAGGSRIYLPLLEPSALGLLKVFPAALFNGFFQPLPGTGGKFIYNIFSVELLLIWALVLAGCLLLARSKANLPGSSGIVFLLFALPGLLIIGYMIPFAGAIIRYRSIYLPFLLAPFLNTMCSYPIPIVHKINHWLEQNTMVENTAGSWWR